MDEQAPAPVPPDAAPGAAGAGRAGGGGGEVVDQQWATAGHAVSPLLMPELDSVRAARAFVEDHLWAAGLATCAADAALAVSELAGNAVLHARTPFTVHLRPTLEGGVRVEVHDESSLPPVFVPPNATAMSGRGLTVVARIAQRWGSHPVVPPDERGSSAPPWSFGKIVWFEVDPSPASRPDTGTIVSALPASERLHEVVVPDLPVVELLVAKEAMDDLLRELQLLLLSPGPQAAGAEEGVRGAADPISRQQPQLDPRLVVAARLDVAARRFEPARRQVRDQLDRATAHHESLVTLRLTLPAWARQAAADYRDALEAAEQLEADRRLSSISGDAGWHTAIRSHYLGEIIRQLPAPRR